MIAYQKNDIRLQPFRLVEIPNPYFSMLEACLLPKMSFSKPYRIS